MFRRSSSSQSGQVLIIFAFAFIAIIMMLALLFDGARALVLRRQMQDASDAAALAGANVIQGLNPPQCSASAGPPPGAPSAAVLAAAKASVATNLPTYPQANVVVTCVSDPSMLNQGVKVRLYDDSPTFFGQIFGGGPLRVGTDSSAVNGNDIRGQFSVVMLDPYNATWASGFRGCPSFLLSGGPTLTFESTIFIDSACSVANGGAFSTNGNSATLTFVTTPPNPPAAMRIVGEYKPATLTVTPAPLEHQTYKPDPFLFITDEPPGPLPPGVTLKVQSNNTWSTNSSTPVLLQPGIYRGGISVGAQGVVYLAPGIYVMNGGGFAVNAGARVYSVPAGINPATYNPATWTSTCVPATCGILLYNTGSANGVTKWGPIDVGAGATFKVRAYNPNADTTKLSTGAAYVPDPLYKNFLIWQSRTMPVPVDTNTAKLGIALGGGGSVFMAGTVYAPTAGVLMKGGSGGSAGDLTLQFVAWDLQLNGNSNFYFKYDAQQFPQLLDYGLIE